MIEEKVEQKIEPKTEARTRKYFGLYITMKRMEKNLTQQDVADLIRCHINTISGIENSKNSVTLDLAFKLCRLLNVSLDDIMNKVLDDA